MPPRTFRLLWMRFLAAEERKDRRAAMTPWMLATIHRKKGKRAPKLEDFMPKMVAKEAKAKQQTVDAMIAIAKEITLAYGGKISQRLLGAA